MHESKNSLLHRKTSAQKRRNKKRTRAGATTMRLKAHTHIKHYKDAHTCAHTHTHNRKLCLDTCANWGYISEKHHKHISRCKRQTTLWERAVTKALTHNIISLHAIMLHEDKRPSSVTKYTWKLHSCSPQIHTLQVHLDKRESGTVALRYVRRRDNNDMCIIHVSIIHSIYIWIYIQKEKYVRKDVLWYIQKYAVSSVWHGSSLPWVT